MRTLAEYCLVCGNRSLNDETSQLTNVGFWGVFLFYFVDWSFFFFLCITAEVLLLIDHKETSSLKQERH